MLELIKRYTTLSTVYAGLWKLELVYLTPYLRYITSSRNNDRVIRTPFQDRTVSFKPSGLTSDITAESSNHDTWLQPSNSRTYSSIFQSRYLASALA